MCGIVGYIGKNDANSVLLNGLKKLEYRGYDSCGIASISKDGLNLLKTTKRTEHLISKVSNDKISNVGIGHTRWATHGGVNEKNAHPHIDNQKRFVVVHNGIIENYIELKEGLINKGYNFYSETDTEIIPNLISLNYNGNLLKTVKKVTDMLEGSFALAILDVNNPEEIVVAKRNSPLIIGIGIEENFIASDFSAISKYTNKVAILENNEFAVLQKNNIHFFDANLNSKNVKIKQIDINDLDVEKNGYEHFMLKEINENSITVRKTLASYVKDEKIKFDLNLSYDDLKNIKHIHIVACGTAMHAGLNGKNVIEVLTQIPVIVEVASEFRYKNPIVNSDDLVIFISQSGETADTIACLELIKERGIKHISIVNVKESTIDRLSDNVIYTKAGPEIAVASTKAYIAQVMVIDLFAIYLANILKLYNIEELNSILKETVKIPSKMEEILQNNVEIIRYAKRISKEKDVFYLGRGLDYFAALEGSLKLKEISYIHSEAIQLGELKHGPIALIEDGTKAIVLASCGKLLDKTINNITEIKARGAEVLVFTTLEEFPYELVDKVIKLPHVLEELSPLVIVMALQLIAYYVTIEKGLDVDKPRNLAKSVTVE